MSDQSPRYTIETSGTCQRMKKRGVPITRENFIREAFADGIPDPWLIEYEAELPEELQDFSIFGPHFGPKPEPDQNPDDSDYDETDMK
jgi:hypothetical protein